MMHIRSQLTESLTVLETHGTRDVDSAAKNTIVDIEEKHAWPEQLQLICEARGLFFFFAAAHTRRDNER